MRTHCIINKYTCKVMCSTDGHVDTTNPTNAKINNMRTNTSCVYIIVDATYLILLNNTCILNILLVLTISAATFNMRAVEVFKYVGTYIHRYIAVFQ